MSPAGVGRPRQAVECPERVSMSWCAPPQACSLPGSLRSMLTTIPLNFAEECASPLVCTGKAKRHGPSVHLQTSRDALHPVAQPWQAGAGKSLRRCSPSLHEWHFRRGGERKFWQGLCTAPGPEGYCSASFILCRDIIKSNAGASVRFSKTLP